MTIVYFFPPRPLPAKPSLEKGMKVMMNITQHPHSPGFLFLERGREGEREGEKPQCERDTLIGCLSSICTTNEAEPATQACAMTFEVELVTFWLAG